jgi:hypothetical protein
MIKAGYDNLDLFTKEFLNLDFDDINIELKEKGYFAFPNAINSNVISNIYQDATKRKINLNKCNFYVDCLLKHDNEN